MDTEAVLTLAGIAAAMGTYYVVRRPRKPEEWVPEAVVTERIPDAVSKLIPAESYLLVNLPDGSVGVIAPRKDGGYATTFDPSLLDGKDIL